LTETGRDTYRKKYMQADINTYRLTYREAYIQQEGQQEAGIQTDNTGCQADILPDWRTY